MCQCGYSLATLCSSDVLLYSDSCLWIFIKYETHLTSLSCRFSSFLCSATLRFSSSFSHCLCSSAAFISAWIVAFFLVFQTITMSYRQSSEELPGPLPVSPLPSFSWVLRFPSSAQRADERGPPWLQRRKREEYYFVFRQIWCACIYCMHMGLVLHGSAAWTDWPVMIGCGDIWRVTAFLWGAQRPSGSAVTLEGKETIKAL